MKDSVHGCVQAASLYTAVFAERKNSGLFVAFVFLASKARERKKGKPHEKVHNFADPHNLV